MPWAFPFAIPFSTPSATPLQKTLWLNVITCYTPFTSSLFFFILICLHIPSISPTDAVYLLKCGIICTFGQHAELRIQTSCSIIGASGYNRIRRRMRLVIILHLKVDMPINAHPLCTQLRILLLIMNVFACSALIPREKADPLLHGHIARIPCAGLR